MAKFLIAVDGSEIALRAVGRAIATIGEYRVAPEVVLVTVHPPVPYAGRAKQLLGQEALDAYYREESEAQLKDARAALDRAGVKYTVRTSIGDPATEIVRIAASEGVDQIFIGTHGRGKVGGLVLGSVAQKVLHAAHLPVTMVH